MRINENMHRMSESNTTYGFPGFLRMPAGAQVHSLHLHSRAQDIFLNVLIHMCMYPRLLMHVYMQMHT